MGDQVEQVSCGHAPSAFAPKVWACRPIEARSTGSELGGAPLKMSEADVAVCLAMPNVVEAFVFDIAYDAA